VDGAAVCRPLSVPAFPYGDDLVEREILFGEARGAWCSPAPGSDDSDRYPGRGRCPRRIAGRVQFPGQRDGERSLPPVSGSATPDATPSDRPSTPAPKATKPGNSKIDRYEAEINRLVNKARVEHGCAPLHRDPRLDKAARLHSQDMAAHSHYSHTSTDGKGPKERMEAQGYDDASSENIDAWPTTPKDAFDAWMHSPGHRANILGCRRTGPGAPPPRRLPLLADAR
jgi:hypothetical protein